MPHVLVLAICGLIIGILSGLLGVGGGFVLVPILVYFFHISMHQAIGTSLVIIIPTALCASLIHFQNGNVSFKMAGSLVIFTIIGGLIGAYFAGMLPAALLKKVFAIVLAVIAVKMFIGN